MILYRTSEGLLALGLVALLLAAGEIGFRLGQAMRHTADDATKAQLSVIQAALLGLLALQLGFTLSMAVSRFEIRQHLVLEEANAIGTAHLRARLVASDGEVIAEWLRDYVDVRVQLNDPDPERRRAVTAETERLQERLWSRAVDVARRDPNPVTNGLLLQALNEVFDLESARMAALENHVPATVVLLVAVLGMIAIGATAYGYGFGERHRRFSVLTLAMAIALVLMVIVDLDRPDRGFIRVNDATMIRLQKRLHASAP